MPLSERLSVSDGAESGRTLGRAGCRAASHTLARVQTLETLNPAIATPLAQLLAERGFTFMDVARGLPGCSFLLLCRIALARQPFPLDLAREVATLTGIDAATLISATGLWTPNGGPSQRVPVPANPLLGDPILAAPSFPTQPLVVPPAPSPSPLVWVVGAGLGEGGDSGAQAVHRNTGVVVHQVTFVNVLAPVEVASDTTNLWTIGNLPGSGGNSWSVVVDPATGDLVGTEEDADYPDVVGVVYEPSEGRVWSCPSTTALIARYPAAGGNADATVSLVDGGTPYYPRDAVAYDGLLYVTAVDTSGVPYVGRVFEVDPAGLAVLRVSTGVDLENAWGICVDDAGDLWTCTRAGGGGTPKVCKVPASTLVAVEVPLVDDPEVLTDPQWVEPLFGSLWVSDSTAPNGRIFSMDAGGNVLQSRTFAGGTAVGHACSDGNFLWYADKAAGLLHMLSPADVSTSPFTVSVGGAPDGLIAVSA